MKLEIDGSIAILTLEGIGRDNRLTAEACLELHKKLKEIAEDDEIRIGVLAGTGSCFTAGFDKEALQKATEAFVEPAGVFVHRYYPERQMPLSLEYVWHTLLSWRINKPIIAAVEGDCLDIGMAILGLHTDIRIAGDGARFGFPGIHTGETPGLAVASRLDRQIPHVFFNSMIEVGHIAGADAACQQGLISEKVPSGSALSRAVELARQITATRTDLQKEKELALEQAATW